MFFYMATWGRRSRPPASWTGLTSSWDTVGMLGHVFDHQPPLTRPPAGRRRRLLDHSSMEILSKSLKINGNQ